MNRCWYCGLEVAQEKLQARAVRTGFSRRYFPQFEYEEVYLCRDCQDRYRKKDKRARILAIIGLFMIFALISLGLAIVIGSIYFS